MPQTEARAWWADVQHVREAIERRRGATGHAGGGAPAVRDDISMRDDTSMRDDARLFDDAVASGSPRQWELAQPRWERGEGDRERVDEPRWRRGEGHLERVDEPRWERVAESIAEPRRMDAARADGSRPPAGHTAAGATTARRTVRITGRPDDRHSTWRPVEIDRRRAPRRPVERVGHRPDRIALWAVLLGFFLILVAATSSHAATSSAHPANHTWSAAAPRAAASSAADARVRLCAATGAPRAR